MGDRVNQHYVPQFHLRKFSPDGKRINILLISDQRIIFRAALRHQCQCTHFYGVDESPENTLSDLEGQVAPIIDGLIASRRLPRRRTDQHSMLVFWVVLQRFRTRRAAEDYEQFETNMFRAVAKTLRNKPNLEDVKIKLRPSIQIPLTNALGIWPILTDLSIHLLVNETSREFVTSDHPVALANDYLFGASGNMSTTGLAAAGLQVLYPLSPRHCLVLYDPRVYMALHSEEDCWHVTSNADVDAINRLELANAGEVAYFLDGRAASHLLKLLETVQPTRLKASAVVDNDPVSPRQLRLYRPSPRIYIGLTCFKIRPDMFGIPLPARTGRVRSVPLLRLVREHSKIIETRYQSEFPKSPRSG